MVYPPYLKPGDRIGILSTARKIRAEEIEAAVQEIQNEWGLEVVLSPHLHAVDHQFAGTDAQRAADLQGMLDDPNLKAILCARGGYGTQRIIDDIRWEGFHRAPKWIFGFSDLTSLLAACHREGIASIHGPMGLSWDGKTSDPGSRAALWELLQGKMPGYQWDTHPLNRPGEALAPLSGGNLSIVHCNLGTATESISEGCILFLEDLDEYLYHIDRMMLHLQRAGKLARLSGLLVGGLTDMNDNAQAFGKTAEEIIAEAVAPYGFPVAFDFPAGHQAANYPLVVGGKARLVVGSDHCQLDFLEETHG